MRRFVFLPSLFLLSTCFMVHKVLFFFFNLRTSAICWLYVFGDLRGIKNWFVYFVCFFSLSLLFLLIFLFYFHSWLLLFLFFVFMFIILYVSSVATCLGSICRMCVCVCERVCDIWHTLEHAHHADHYHNHYHHDDELLMINKMMIKAKKAHRFVVRCFLMKSASGRESC